MATISFSGLASGIDGEAIIKATSDSKRLLQAPLQNKIEDNTAETTALNDFNTKMLALSSSLKDFLTLAGGAVTKKASTSDSEVLSAIAGSSAVNSSTVVTVNTLARSATMSFDDRFTSTTEPMFPGLAGESQVELNVGSGAEQKTFSFKVDSTTTLTSLATEINKVASGKLQAAVINAGTSQSPQYLLTITSTSQGTQKGLLEINVGAEIQAEGGFSSFQMSQAEDAKINIEGVGDIVRSSNQINDVIPGVSLDLKRAGTGPIIVSVQNDADKTVAKFGEVVAALNDLITYSKENSKIEQTQDSKGIKNIYGSLAKTRVDDQAIESIKGAIFGARVTDSNSELRILADLGLTIERAGTYAFDEEKLKEAIGKDSNSASQIIQSFADKLGTTNGIISQYTRFQGQIHLSKIANEDSTRLSQERIDRMEANLLRQEQAMRLLFANLESRIGEMNSQGNALSSIIQSINPS